MVKSRKIEGPFEEVELIKSSGEVKITKSFWRGWSKEEKDIFENVYQYGIDNQSILKHPKGPSIHEDHWRTLVHNFAFLAAKGLKDIKNG